MPGPGYRSKKNGGKGRVKPKSDWTKSGAGGGGNFKKGGGGSSRKIARPKPQPRKKTPNTGHAPKKGPAKQAPKVNRGFVGPVKVTPKEAAKARYRASFETNRPGGATRVKGLSHPQIREQREWLKKNALVGLNITSSKKGQWGKPIGSFKVGGNKFYLHFGDRDETQKKFLAKKGGKLDSYQPLEKAMGVTEGKGKEGGKKSEVNPYGYKAEGKVKDLKVEKSGVGDALGNVFKAWGVDGSTPKTTVGGARVSGAPEMHGSKALQANLEVFADNPATYTAKTVKAIPATAAGIVGAPLQIATDVATEGPVKAVGRVVDSVKKDFADRYGADKKQIKKQIEKEGGLSYLLDASVLVGGAATGIGKAVGKSVAKRGFEALEEGKPLTASQRLMTSPRPKLGTHEGVAERQIPASNIIRRAGQQALDNTRRKVRGGTEDSVTPLLSRSKGSRVKGSAIVGEEMSQNQATTFRLRKVKKAADKLAKDPVLSAAGWIRATLGVKGSEKAYQALLKEYERVSQNRSAMDQKTIDAIVKKAKGNERKSLSSFEALTAFANDKQLFLKSFNHPTVEKFIKEARSADVDISSGGVPGMRDIDVAERRNRPQANMLGQDINMVDWVRKVGAIPEAKTAIAELRKDVDSINSVLVKEQKTLKSHKASKTRKNDAKETIEALVEEKMDLRKQITEILNDPDYNRRAMEGPKQDVLARTQSKAAEYDLEPGIYAPEFAASRSELPKQVNAIVEGQAQGPTKYFKNQNVLRNIGEVAADARLIPEGLANTGRKQTRVSALKRATDDMIVSPRGKWLTLDEAEEFVAGRKGLVTVPQRQLIGDVERLYKSGQLEGVGDAPLKEWISEVLEGKKELDASSDEKYVVVDEVLRDTMQDLVKRPGKFMSAIYKGNGLLSAAILATPPFVVAQVLQQGLGSLAATGGKSFVHLMRRRYPAMLKNIDWATRRELESKAGIGHFSEHERRNLLDTSQTLDYGKTMDVLHKPFNWAGRLDQWQTGKFRGATLYNELNKIAKGMEKHSTEYMDVWKNPKFKEFWDQPNRESQLAYLAKHPEIQDMAAKKLDEFMGNWTRYTPAERKLAGSVFMFYGFVRYATKLALYTLPVDHPLMTAIGLKMAQLHRDEMEDLYGDDYIGALGSLVSIHHDGKIEPIDTAKLNPIAGPLFQAADQIGRAKSLDDATRAAVSSALAGANPLIKTGLQAGFGRDLYSGNDMIINGEYHKGPVPFSLWPRYFATELSNAVGPTRMLNQIAERAVLRQQPSDDSIPFLKALDLPGGGVPKNVRARGRKVSGKQIRANREKYKQPAWQVALETALGFKAKQPVTYKTKQAIKKSDTYNERKRRENERNAG